MRPKSLVWFDWCYLAALTISFVNILATFGLSGAAKQVLVDHGVGADAAEIGVATLGAATILRYLLKLVIWYWVSRRASNFAKWLWLGFIGIDFVGLPPFMMHSPLDTQWLVVLLLACLKIAAAIFLFRPDARRWFASKGQAVDPDVFS